MPLLLACGHEAAVSSPLSLPAPLVSHRPVSDSVLAEHPRWSTWSGTWRWLCWESQVNEDLADHDGIDDEADDAPLAFAFGAEQDVMKEDPLDQFGPGGVFPGWRVIPSGFSDQCG